jgi:hypothetical protein
MASIILPVNIKKLLDAQAASINNNVNNKTSTIANTVTAKAAETQALVQIENDETQTTLASMATGTDLNANTASVNAHTTAKANEILASVNAIPTLENQIDPAGVNSFYYDVALGSGLMTIFSRVGSGFICQLIVSKSIALEIYIDGVKAYTKPAEDSAGNSNIVLYSAKIAKMPYNQSIEIKAERVFDFTGGVSLSHVMLT